MVARLHGAEARVATLQDGDLGILHHMFGTTDHCPQLHCGCRNEYVANRRDLPAPRRMVGAGFVRVGRPLLNLRYFHATQIGCKLAGLSYAAIARALGVRL